MLLRNEMQMALNEVESLCIETADHYAAAAQRAEAPALAQTLTELGSERLHLAEELGGHIRALDDLPKSPDPDRETVGDILEGIKAFLSGDAQRSLIEDRLRFEDKVADAVHQALRLDLPPETQALLSQILGHVDKARTQLGAAQKT